MHDRLRLLTRGHDRHAPARQRTLRAALEWSEALLQPDEQRLFRRLAVMAGSASLAFIERVTADAGFDRWAVLDALDALVDRSLVALLPAPDDGAPRYRLLESPRAYAQERLDAAGERAELQCRHAQALAEIFDAAYDDYFSGRIGALAWQQALLADQDNARDALAWARAAGDAALQLRIGTTLLRVLPSAQHAERRALAEACEACLAAARPDALPDALPEPLPDALPEPLQFRGWIELGCAWADTQKQRTREAAERALALARRLDPAQPDRYALYHALCRAASAAAQTGDLAGAQAPLAELRALEDPAWPPHRLLWGAEAEQVVARLRGDAAEALQRMRRLVELDRARGSDASVGLGNLVDAELASGDAAAAARFGTELVAELQGTRLEYSLAFTRLNLCAALLALDQPAPARAIAEAAWPQALVYELQPYAAAYLGLLAALERRAAAAARLIGYSEAGYAARDEVAEANEARALERARALAQGQLDAAAMASALAAGAALRDADIAAIAFAET